MRHQYMGPPHLRYQQQQRESQHNRMFFPHHPDGAPFPFQDQYFHQYNNFN